MPAEHHRDHQRQIQISHERWHLALKNLIEKGDVPSLLELSCRSDRQSELGDQPGFN
jgi:hypothetical protein